MTKPIGFELFTINPSFKCKPYRYSYGVSMQVSFCQKAADLPAPFAVCVAKLATHKSKSQVSSLLSGCACHRSSCSSVLQSYMLWQQRSASLACLVCSQMMRTNCQSAHGLQGRPTQILLMQVNRSLTAVKTVHIRLVYMMHFHTCTMVLYTREC